MSLGAPMLWEILLRLGAAFVIMAMALVILSTMRRLPWQTRKGLWLKLGVYYAVVHAFLIFLWVGGWWFRSALTVIAIFACRELLSARVRPERSRPYEYVAYAATAVLVLYAPRAETCFGILAATLLVLLSLPVLLRQTAHALERIASALLGVLVASILSMVLADLRETHANEAVFFYLIVVLEDAFAQVGGQLFGRRPWFQTISPKKTLEGTLAGIAACLAGAVVFRTLMPIPLAWTAALAVLIALCGNLGDLAFSALKRSAGIKDFSNLIPGHGGVLDRFDSLLFTGPVFYVAVRSLGA